MALAEWINDATGRRTNTSACMSGSRHCNCIHQQQQQLQRHVPQERAMPKPRPPPAPLLAAAAKLPKALTGIAQSVGIAQDVRAEGTPRGVDKPKSVAGQAKPVKPAELAASAGGRRLPQASEDPFAAMAIEME